MERRGARASLDTFANDNENRCSVFSRTHTKRNKRSDNFVFTTIREKETIFWPNFKPKPGKEVI